MLAALDQLPRPPSRRGHLTCDRLDVFYDVSQAIVRQVAPFTSGGSRGVVATVHLTNTVNHCSVCEFWRQPSRSSPTDAVSAARRTNAKPLNSGRHRQIDGDESKCGGINKPSSELNFPRPLWNASSFVSFGLRGRRRDLSLCVSRVKVTANAYLALHLCVGCAFPLQMCRCLCASESIQSVCLACYVG
mmetsp:Transcript_37390/g.107002  ORF Transcript_37390/g.107002 Transcript_37390/m.107002 type:complete len:189 (+) Transcript_37390:361-927(+)